VTRDRRQMNSSRKKPSGSFQFQNTTRMVVETSQKGPCRSKSRRTQFRTRMGKVFKPLVIVFATLYFIIDAIFFSLIKPLGTRLSRLPIFTRVGIWIQSLSPYPTFALFAVPLVVLEPIKPVGLYLIASGNVIDGSVLIAVGEVAKITIVERIFHAGRDKLLTIPAFAWSYERVMALRAYLETLAVWQAMLKSVRVIKETAHRMWAFAKDCFGLLKRVK
jgi:hypothetical protein